MKCFAIRHVSYVHCICSTSVTFFSQLCESRLNQKLRVSTTRVSRQSVPPFLMTSTSDRTEKQIRKECRVFCLQLRTTKSTATSSLYCYNVHSRKAGTWPTATYRTPPLCNAYRVANVSRLGKRWIHLYWLTSDSWLIWYLLYKELWSISCIIQINDQLQCGDYSAHQYLDKFQYTGTRPPWMFS